MSDSATSPVSEPRTKKASDDAVATKKAPAARRKPAAMASTAKPKASTTKSSTEANHTADAEHVRELAMARAEQIVDQVGYKVGRWATRLVARTREEAEDIWAEAQHVRNSGRN